MDDEGTASSTAVSEALRAWAASFNEVGRRFGVHLGMHVTEAAALIHITAAEERGTPLTQSQLARRIGLSTPATSTLLTRLQRAGHVERRRDQMDGRVVTLRSTTTVHDEVQAYFGTIGDDLAAVVSGYSPDEVAASLRMIVELTAVLEGHIVKDVERK